MNQPMPVFIPSHGRSVVCLRNVVPVLAEMDINATFLVTDEEYEKYGRNLPRRHYIESVGEHRPRVGKAVALDWIRKNLTEPWCLVLDDDVQELGALSPFGFWNEVELSLERAEASGCYLVGVEILDGERPSPDMWNWAAKRPFQAWKQLWGSAFLWYPRNDMPVPLRLEDDRWLTFEHALRDHAVGRANSLYAVTAPAGRGQGGHGLVGDRERFVQHENKEMAARYGKLFDNLGYGQFYEGLSRVRLNYDVGRYGKDKLPEWTPFDNDKSPPWIAELNS